MAFRPIHPGEHLAKELKEPGMSAAQLARNLAVLKNRVTSILNRQRAITGETALRFGTLLRDHSQVLAEPAEPVRYPLRPDEGRQVHRSASQIEAGGTHPPRLRSESRLQDALS
jgi:addiction module HigA family antidote